MSITDHPDERVRLLLAIRESQEVIDVCPMEGDRSAPCRTCEKHHKVIAEYRAALGALDADEVHEAQQPTEYDTRDYVDVPAGSYGHPGDEIYIAQDGETEIWMRRPFIEWGEVYPEGAMVRRPRTLDIHLPSVIDKAERLAKKLTDPVRRERLLYTIQQQKTALAENLRLVMEDIERTAIPEDSSEVRS